ncbi:hypothetical protein KIPB_000896 [Kipferlia bialata]|uniref:PX domain-containing protein n=1 Tax=Kipferlia bialata TaxID=797122 RepID=A0A9K3CP78_9EUKA|nr:hypothetical protein KIPB_000896 [Kipferlia bialata]|eukprot:g896.t1
MTSLQSSVDRLKTRAKELAPVVGKSGLSVEVNSVLDHLQSNTSEQDTLTAVAFLEEYLDTLQRESELRSALQTAQTDAEELALALDRSTLESGYIYLPDTHNSVVDGVMPAGGRGWGLPVAKDENPLKDCAITRVVVDEAVQHKGRFHPFHSYRVLTITTNGRIYMVRRRFNDLKALHKGLSTRADPPPFPSVRHWALGGGKPEFIAVRVREMSRYLERVCGSQLFAESEELHAFFTDGAEFRPQAQGY